jgi:hypothetical protein
MNVLNLLFDHFWEVVIFLFLFGGSIWAGIQWILKRTLKHRETMQEKRNEELRLLLQIEQAKNNLINTSYPSSTPVSVPKDVSWEEQTSASYETGYQQQF